jgi:glycerophosphoryl diester phosphodiesterase
MRVNPVTSVIAHRGASAHQPENTVAAFAAAVTFGADGVELDVRRTADGALAVVHDGHLPDGRAVADVAGADLPDAVCVLADALAACGDLLVNVEIKSDGPGAGVPLAAPVVDACERWGGRALVSSFDPATVDAVRALAPSFPSAQLTFLLDRSPADVVAAIVERGHAAWHPHHATLDEEAVTAARAAGLAVNTWTVDDPDRIVTLAGWGVDGIVTNDVPMALRALGR